MTAIYDDVAVEYYDQTLHPTCFDFGQASSALAADALTRVQPRGSLVETGAGKSYFLRTPDALPDDATLLLTDASEKMLDHSRRIAGPNVTCAIALSDDLPCADASVDFVLSLLADPYNTPSFWAEVARVLKPGARAFYTTPSYVWATSFRSEGEGEVHDSAMFLTTEGKQVYVPSYVIDPEDQATMIARAGLTVEQVTHFTLANRLGSGEQVSRKLSGPLGEDAPVVTGFLVVKPA